MVNIIGDRLNPDELEMFVRLLNWMTSSDKEKFGKMLKLHQMSK